MNKWMNLICKDEFNDYMILHKYERIKQIEKVKKKWNMLGR